MKKLSRLFRFRTCIVLVKISISSCVEYLLFHLHPHMLKKLKSRTFVHPWLWGCLCSYCCGITKSIITLPSSTHPKLKCLVFHMGSRLFSIPSNFLNDPFSSLNIINLVHFVYNLSVSKFILCVFQFSSNI